ncbi:hypothetical protein [Geomobilimonas luticola]|uniref:Uncharacterized protein n=1 Tax=Geomobilimonas luticola TaxID=1114878 RepID=A0ABS5SCG2_9BACT|nr:hypothetical protein [Geomobilimonas luticola]MBT0653064.1 hypothetical protein [Geomobilimonas luticola]
MGMFGRWLIVLLLAGLLMGTTSVRALASPDPQCACAYCDRPCGSGHAPGCQYYSGGGEGGGGGGGGGDITNAPIVLAPVGFIGGLFMGAGWYFEEMAGNFPKTGFLDSYGNYVSIKPADDNKAFNFGARLGGLPWLALYLPSWPIRAGIVAIADTASRPSPPKPVDPNIAVYELIAKNYAFLNKTTEQELKKAQGDVEAALMLRTKFLDRFINDSPELRDLRQKEGVDAARAKAQKQLDAWSKSRDEKQKISMAVVNRMQDNYAVIRAANDAVGPIGSSSDLGLYGTETHIKELLKDKSLTQGVQESLLRGEKITGLLGKAKTTFDISSNLKGIWDTYAKAEREGKDADQWYKERETREQVWRLRMKLLTIPLSSTAGAAVSAAETTMDIAHATTAGVLLGRRIDADLALLEKLETATVFQDAMADDWKRVTISVKAAEEIEGVIRQRSNQYKKMQKENETHARNLRNQ